MEENKKIKEEVKEESKKLSYEELENAARQLSVQLDALLKENRQLKVAAGQLQMNNLYTELNFRFKVIELQDSFDPEFVESCVNEIQKIMTSSDENNDEESKEDTGESAN